jgi:ABC-type amino acid transport substrate-binding protein
VSVLGKSGSSLDPCLYDLERHGARVALFSGTINDLIPAVVRGDAEATLMDVPAAVDALDIWAGRIKVIGPLSPTQHMAVAFAKNSPRLRAEFDLFLAKRKADGTYLQLVRKHFPGAVERQRDFFKDCRDEAAPGANR